MRTKIKPRWLLQRTYKGKEIQKRESLYVYVVMISFRENK